MKKSVRTQVLLAALGLLAMLSQPMHADDTKGKEAPQQPDATIKFHGGTFGIGVGFSWGSGVLNYKGKEYPFSVEGLSTGAVGGASVEASGEVYNLKKLDDFSGNYVSSAAGATAGGGAAAAAMRNQNGVNILLIATTKGLGFNLAGSGVKIRLKD